MEQNGASIKDLNRGISLVRNPISAWIVLIGAICLTFGMYTLLSQELETRAEERLSYRAQEITSAIAERMDIYEYSLQSAVALFNASEHVDRNEWRAFTHSLLASDNLPGVQGVGYSIPVSKELLTEHEAQIRTQGFSDYQVYPKYPRDFYTPVIYIEPFDSHNQRKLGHDMWADETRKDAMVRAMEQGFAASSGRVSLIEQSDRDIQFGFLMFAPVYETKMVPSTVQQRRDKLQGWVYAAFRAQDILQNIKSFEQFDINFRIYDKHPGHTSLLYDSHPGVFTDDKQGSTNNYQYESKITVQGRPWIIQFSANQSTLLSRHEINQPRYLLAIAIFVDALLIYVILSLHMVNRYSFVRRKELEVEFEENQKNLANQQKILEAKEQEADTFFELAPDPFVIVNGDGIIVRANQRAHRIFGYLQESMVGIGIEQLIPENLREQHQQFRENFQKTSMSRMMGSSKAFQAMKRDGSSLLVEINLVPIFIQHEKHWVAAIHDVSAQKHLEHTLEDARIKAEDASRSKSEFVANMSHEIRTPLNAVLGAAQLLKKTPLNQEQKKYLSMVRSSGEALLGIINDILDFSKIEAGKMELAHELFSLQEILARLANIMSVNVNEKEIDLVIDVYPDVPDYLVGDGLRLQQVLINLASNAIKFTESGRVHVIIRLLDTLSKRVTLGIQVIDTGIGMDDQQQSLLFQAFSQADTSITRKFGGTGLGLVISSKIVQLLDGEFSVESKKGSGSNFSFSAGLDVSEIPQVPQSTTAELNIAFVDRSAEALSSYENIALKKQWNVVLAQSWLDLYDTDIIQALNALVFRVSLDADFRKHIEQLYLLGLPESCHLIFILDSQQQAVAQAADLRREYTAGIVKPIITSNLLAVLREANNADRPSEKEQAYEHESEEGFQTFAGVRALVVEDNLLNQTIAAGILEDLHVKFTIVDNGQEAVNYMQHNQDNVDIILMDIQMPIMDGVTATKIIRNELKLSIPIVALTAGVLHSEQKAYLDVGIDAIVPKPIDFNELVATLARQIHPTQTKRKIIALNAPREEELCDFNGKRILSLARGKQERIAKLLSSVENIIASGDEEISKAVLELQEGNEKAALSTFHGLKGVVANYGAEKLSESIATLEKLIKAELSQELKQELNQELSLEKNKDQMLQEQVNLVRTDFVNFSQAAKAWMSESKHVS